MNRVTFELHFERWAGFHFVEIESLGDGAGREKASQWGIQDAAANELLFFVVLEEDGGYNFSTFKLRHKVIKKFLTTCYVSNYEGWEQTEYERETDKYIHQ